jgi:hypothetical protein
MFQRNQQNHLETTAKNKFYFCMKFFHHKTVNSKQGTKMNNNYLELLDCLDPNNIIKAYNQPFFTFQFSIAQSLIDMLNTCERLNIADYFMQKAMVNKTWLKTLPILSLNRFYELVAQKQKDAEYQLLLDEIAMALWDRQVIQP